MINVVAWMMDFIKNCDPLMSFETQRNAAPQDEPAYSVKLDTSSSSAHPEEARRAVSKDMSVKNYLIIANAIILILSMCSLHAGNNPFKFPKQLPHAARERNKAHASFSGGETPLEQELLSLGKEIQTIADELVKALSSKEVKQELEKKASAASKPSSASKGGKFGKSGGYRPGSFGGSKPYGAGGKPYGASSKPFGGYGSGSSYGGSGYSGSNYGGGFGSFGKSKLDDNKPAGSGLSGDPSSPHFGTGASSKPDLGSKPASSSTSGSSWTGRADKKGDLAETLQTKISNLNTALVNLVEKEFGKIAKESDPEVRSRYLHNINLSELNKICSDIEITTSSLDPKILVTIKATADWKKAETKLKGLQGRVVPILIELMMPLEESGIAAVGEARKAFKNLKYEETVARRDLQKMALMRCEKIVESFKTKQSRIPHIKARPISNEAVAAQNVLGAELTKIIEALPTDLVGTPIPPALKKLAERLSKKPVAAGPP